MEQEWLAPQSITLQLRNSVARVYPLGIGKGFAGIQKPQALTLRGSVEAGS